jgi:hypothetical protein
MFQFEIKNNQNTQISVVNGATYIDLLKLLSSQRYLDYNLNREHGVL